VQYMLLICGDEEGYAEASEEDRAQVFKEYGAVGEEMAARGVLESGARLRPTADASTVRVRDGEVLVADGPFAETKEQIGGFYIVNCKDLDEATEIAAKIPGAKHGTIEVRPLWEM
jgi:hypothetical protein